MGLLLDWLLKGIERDARKFAEGGGLKPGEFPFRGETATSADDIYGSYWGAQKYNPDDLAAKKGGLKIYANMRQDDQVKAALHLKKSAILFPGWKIECDDEALEEYAEHVLEEMDGTVEETIRSILSGYDYGFSLHEKVFRVIEEGEFKGKIGLKALKAKSPTRIDFRTDDYGNLLPMGILQRQNLGEYKPLPVEKFVLFSYRKEFDNYYGESDLRAAYRFWFLKVNFFRYWGLYLERFGIPLALGKSAKATMNASDQTKFREIVANLQAGMAAVLPPDLEIEFKEAAASRGETFSKAVDACDIRIARSVLVPQLVGLAPQGDTGSLARANVEAGTFDLVLGGDTRQVEDCINEQVLKPLIRMNFGEVEEFPRFKINPMREEDRKALVAAWSDAVSKKSATSTLQTEAYVRELLKFPEPTEEERDELEERKEAGMAGLEALAGNGGAPGAGGGPRKPGEGAPGDSARRGKGVAPGGEENGRPGANAAEKGGRVYVLTTLNAQEARKAWKQHIEQLDGLESEATRAISQALEESITALVEDAGKK